MPKAILVFKLPEDNDEFTIARSAGAMFCALHDIKNYARQLDRYDDREQLGKEEVVKMLYELIGELPDVN